MLIKIDNRQEGILLAALKLLNGIEVTEDSVLFEDLTRDGDLPDSTEIDRLISGLAGSLQATTLGEVAAELVTHHNTDADSDAFIEAARKEHAGDDLEIDDVALISRADDGCWVSAWVWVTNADAGVEPDEADDTED